MNMERKKIMTWMLTWLNMNATALNATFQLLVIYKLSTIKIMQQNNIIFLYLIIYNAVDIKIL